MCMIIFQDVVDDCSKITHTHHDAMNGAKLQCAAVHLALHHQGEELLNVESFVSKLKEIAQDLEKEDTGDGSESDELASPKKKRRAKR